MSESKRDHKMNKNTQVTFLICPCFDKWDQRVSIVIKASRWSQRWLSVTRLQLDTLVADNIGITWPNLTVECPPCHVSSRRTGHQSSYLVCTPKRENASVPCTTAHSFLPIVKRKRWEGPVPPHCVALKREGRGGGETSSLHQKGRDEP